MANVVPLSRIGRTQPDGSRNRTVYRKPSQTDLHLQWDSHHTILAKYSVISTQHHRARAVCSRPSALAERRISAPSTGKMEMPLMGSQQIKAEDQSCGWKQQQQQKELPIPLEVLLQTTKCLILVVPYTKGLSDSLKKACSKHGVQVYFRGDRTIRSLLVAPKDKDPIIKKSEVHI